MLVIVDQVTGDRFARLAGHKGIAEGSERMWLVKQASGVLTTWGHQGGVEGRIVLNSDGEASMFKEDVARWEELNDRADAIMQAVWQKRAAVKSSADSAAAVPTAGQCVASSPASHSRVPLPSSATERTAAAVAV